MDSKMEKETTSGKEVVITALRTDSTPGSQKRRVDLDLPDLNRQPADLVVFDTGSRENRGLVWFAEEKIIGQHLVSFTGKSNPYAIQTDAPVGEHPYGFFVEIGDQWVMVEGHSSPPKIKIIDPPPTRTGPNHG